MHLWWFWDRQNSLPLSSQLRTVGSLGLHARMLRHFLPCLVSDIINQRRLHPFNPLSPMLAKTGIMPPCSASSRSFSRTLLAHRCLSWPWRSACLGSCCGGAWNSFSLGFLPKWIWIIVRESLWMGGALPWEQLFRLSQCRIKCFSLVIMIF